MIKAAQAPRVFARVECGNRVGREGAEGIQRAIDRPQYAFDVSVCERRSNKPYNFAVARIIIAMHELHRITCEMLFFGKCVQEIVEVVLEGGHTYILTANAG